MEKLAFCFLLAGMLSTSAHAYVGAVSSATAEAGRASVEATDAPFLNPASLPYLKGYIFSAGYATARDQTDSRGQDFAVAISDNMTETVVPTSLGFVQSKADFASEDQVVRDFRLNFGNFIRKGFALGIGVRYKDDQLPENRYNQLNSNVGALMSMNENVGFAAVFENILGAKADIPESARLRPSMAFGGTYIYRRFFRTRADVITASNNSFDRPILAAGIETYMNKWIILRFGAQRRNEEKANVYSTGIGFTGPRFGIHYAYLSSPDLESFTRHTVDLAVPIW